MLSQAFLPRKTANSSIMEQYARTASWVSMMQGLKLLTLHRLSILGDSHDVVHSIIAKNGGR